MIPGVAKTAAGRRRNLIVLSVISAAYAVWRVGFTVPLRFGVVSAILGIALVVAELTAIIEALLRVRDASAPPPPGKPEIHPEMYPHVDILIATHNEDPELLRKTVTGCLGLKYPNPRKVHIYLCDDTNRPAVKQLAADMGVGYLGLTGNRHAKAGNLNNALSRTASPLVATLDADMIPMSGFLLQTVPYFFIRDMVFKGGVWQRRKGKADRGPKVGFVQTPQSFYNADLFQFNLYAENNIPNEQDYFFREVNVGRNHTNSVIYAGSNTLISREALAAVGGIRTGTITEDFATGIDIQAAGYTTYATDTVLAHGLAPTDFTSLVKQRQRWARGCIQVLRDPRFLKAKLPLPTKLSYFSSFLYWFSFIRRFVYILSPIAYSVFGVLVVNCTPWQLLGIWLPFHILYNYVLAQMNGRIWSTRWSNITDTVLFPYLIVPVISEALGLHLKRFAVTPKAARFGKNSEGVFAIPHILLIIFSAIGIVECLQHLSLANIGSVVILYWLVMNGYFLVSAVICLQGRIDFEQEPHFPVDIPGSLHAGMHAIEVTIDDIAESGMSFSLDSLTYLPSEQDFTIRLSDRDYAATLSVRQREVHFDGQMWRYTLAITGCTEADRRQYTQILFDRDHPFPTRVQVGILRDAWAFLVGYRTRRLPRDPHTPSVPLGDLVATTQGPAIEVARYANDHVVIRHTKPLPDDLTLAWGGGIWLTCHRAPTWAGAHHETDMTTYTITAIAYAAGELTGRPVTGGSQDGPQETTRPAAADDRPTAADQVIPPNSSARERLPVGA